MRLTVQLSMKKALYLFLLIMLPALSALSAHAATVGTPLVPLTRDAIADMTPEQKQARVAEVKQRIEEIKAMDKSQLTRPERKALRAELRGLKKESADWVGILYIGSGLLVFIGLLLIIFLR
jgi:hypothetical protein